MKAAYETRWERGEERTKGIVLVDNVITRRTEREKERERRRNDFNKFGAG